MKYKKRKKENKTLAKLGLFFIILSSLVILDQITKYITINYFDFKEGSKWGKSKIIDFGYISNTSTTIFTMLGLKFSSWAIILMNFLFLIFFTLLSIFTQKKWIAIFGSIVAAGTLGNLMDRLILQGVIDWLNFPWANNGYFNFADCYIVFGSVFLLFSFLFYTWK